ncbi:protein of unknown function UPF0079 [Rippkaea orientalis PCC 8801]|uniref:tRNA threonylcarbamoyladenosine biosynthesis protein TsaE n=1 Tax=Rippkaea orientalis (strain PCC 8801 / RF-1) TaxID=41431 RepID=B7K2M6_RIPO1|nr:tRNA (adenosine(37)-N6)-threonylcarbamoyltransferase complex ATPase subunit type 1 TsaE [Rippkaea orientalis]ACK66419.1 protein of unknown function UPF0079 [Rippkaea orientalis PCC 8801]
MLVIDLVDPQATQRFGEQLGTLLPAGTVILLEGELGAGKTTLVQGIAESLGIKSPIVSPTFTIVNEYNEGRLPLYHLDLYRLSSEEIEKLYPDIYWEGEEVPPGITAIEWAQRLPHKPLAYLDIKLTYLEEQGRQAIIGLVGNLGIDINRFQ